MIIDGGPLRPCTIEGVTYHGETLRDSFARDVMAILLLEVQGKIVNPDDIANSAYEMADAMLRERIKPKGTQ